MDFTVFFILSLVLTIIFFSSGITVFNQGHLRYLREVGKRNKVAGWIADVVLSTITVTSRMRRVWIRMISPGPDVD